MVAQRHAVLQHAARLHPGDRVVQRDPRAGDGGGARAAVGLEHVAVEGDLPLAERGEIGDGAKRTPDQPLDLLRAAGLLAGRRLAAGALCGGAGQHAVFRRDPALATALEPWRHGFADARHAQHMGLAEAHEAGAFGMAGHAALEADGAQGIYRAFGWAHSLSA